MDVKEELVDLAEKSVTKVVDSGVIGIRDVTNIFINDYFLRRDVGFKFGQSISGAYKDTKMYCRDVLRGKEPRIMKEAVTFNK